MLYQQVCGYHDAAIGRRDHGGVIAGAEDGGLAPGQSSGYPRDQAELSELRNGDITAPSVRPRLAAGAARSLRYVLLVRLC
jgi:hypothetical protein